MAGKVQAHRDGEGTAEPGRIGPALPQREHADVERTIRQTRHEHRQRNDPCTAGKGEHGDRNCRRQGADPHDEALSPFAVEPAGDQRRRHGGEPENRPNEPDEGSVLMDARKHHDGQSNDHHAETNVQERNHQGNAAKAGVVEQDVPNTGQRFGQDGPVLTRGTRLRQPDDHQRGENVEPGRGQQRDARTRPGREGAGQRRARARCHRIGNTVERVGPIPEWLGNDQWQ
ncbi:MAG TPA: hypothetical protein VE951_03585 [Candidatus Angelobacter sp.]|nr:hypothetical protein [Candidatus Angelobacter sp.]